MIVEALDGQVHARWDAGIRPVAEVEPGEVVVIRTRTGEDGQLRPGDGPEALDRLDFGRLHALTGPVAVRGAMPGDLLVVDVLALEPAPWGFLLERPGAGLLRDRPNYLRFVEIDARAGLVRFAPGINIPLRPFLGVMGVAPAAGPLRTIEPGPHGGNLDCRSLGVGARLHLRVQVPGALFSCGDGHAAQGDGEVCVTAVETSMTATLRLGLARAATRVRNPVAATPEAWITLAAAGRVEDAAAEAVQDMIDLIVASTDLTAGDAYALVSAAGDVRINQLVNGGAMGVRVELPRAVVPGLRIAHEAPGRA